MRLHLLTLALAALTSPVHAARYTYHGDLLVHDVPAAGRYDLRVRTLASPDAKAALAEPTELPNVAVVDGRFSVEVDVPDNPAGDTWIEVALRPAGSTAAYETLGAPQPIAKANSSCPGAWALDGNTGVPAGSFLGFADPASSLPLELRVKNGPVARFTQFANDTFYGDAPTIVMGSSANYAISAGATVAGGGSTLDASDAACATCGNLALGIFTTVSGGQSNEASGNSATIAGGSFNNTDGGGATVGGGLDNKATGVYATVPGGRFNTADGQYSVAVGLGACAGGDNSLASGLRAKIRGGTEATDTACGGPSGDSNGDEGTFAWADAQPLDFVSSGPNQFLVRAQGGVGINAAPSRDDVELTVVSDADNADYVNVWLKQRAASNAGMLVSVGDATGSNNNAAFYIDHYTGALQARRFALNNDGSVVIRSNVTEANTGVTMAANAGAWSSLSDRRLKTAIEAIDPVAVLDRLIATPITTWSYRAQGEAVRHIGPMAQDFAKAFGVGENDTTISTVDADGVALAAIQGLNAKLERENAALRAQLDDVVARLQQLEAQGEGR